MNDGSQPQICPHCHLPVDLTSRLYCRYHGFSDELRYIAHDRCELRNRLVRTRYVPAYAQMLHQEHCRLLDLPESSP